MDAIQHTLIKAGRKDLAQKYYQKIIAESLKPHEKNVKEHLWGKKLFTSKPFSINNLKSVPLKNISEVAKDVKKLKVLTPEKIWDDDFTGEIGWDFDNKVPVVFVLKANKRFFIINTDGNTYPRYAVEIKGY